MEDVKLDGMSQTFIRVMEFLTVIGLVVMIIPAIGYFAGIRQFVDVKETVRHWDKPASKFWEETRQINVDGYSWLRDNITYTDCLSILGIIVLMLAPLLSIIAAIPKSEGIYALLFLVLAIEFLIAVLRPLFMQMIGD